MSPLTSALVAAAIVIAFAVILPFFAGFRGQKPQDYRRTSPTMDPRRHLSGPILCEGVIYGPTGRVTSRFVAEMEGVWTGNMGVLKERFRYDTGTVQNREWRLSLGNDGALKAEADDLVGTGTGTLAGASLQMLYKLRLPAAAGGHVLDVTDWMYLCENGTIMNRSQFTKFGIKVAELVATMRPLPV